MQRIVWCLCVMAVVAASADRIQPKPKETSGSELMLPTYYSWLHSSMGDVVLHIIEHYIRPHTSTLVIMQKCAHCQRAHRQSRLVEYMLSKFHVLMKLQLYFEMDDDVPLEHNLFIVDSSQAFQQLHLRIPQSLYDQELRFFIILNVRRSESMQSIYFILHRIMMICAELKVISPVVMLRTGRTTFDFYSYEMQSTKRCYFRQRLVKINTWKNGALRHNYLYPKRIHNFNGCLLKISARVMPPVLTFFGNFNDSKHLQQLERLGGFEGNLLKILAKNLNFRIRLQITNGENEIKSNESSTGAFGELHRGVVDVVLGGYERSHENSRVFSVSVPYHQSPKIFVVRSTLTFGPLKQLANPFDVYVWLMIALTVVVAVITIKLVEYYRSKQICMFIIGNRTHTPISNLLTILLGNPVVTLPRRNFARYLVMLWILLSLLLRNAYQGKMFDALRISRREPRPHTITALAERQYTLFASRYVDYYPHNLTIVSLNLTERYMMVMSSERSATISLLDTLAYFNYYNRNYSCLTYVNEPVYTHQMVMFFRRHSVLRKAFDYHIKALIDSGITSHIVQKWVKSEYRNMNEGNKFVAKINNDMLIGLYVIYGVLNLLAILILWLELRARHSVRLRSVLDWFHYN